MSNLSLQCPATGLTLDTGIDMSAKNLAENWNELAHAMCPRCGVEHSGIVRELYQADVLSDWQGRSLASR